MCYLEGRHLDVLQRRSNYCELFCDKRGGGSFGKALALHSASLLAILPCLGNSRIQFLTVPSSLGENHSRLFLVALLVWEWLGYFSPFILSTPNHFTPELVGICFHHIQHGLHSQQAMCYFQNLMHCVSWA